MLKIITAYTIVICVTICFFTYKHSIEQQLKHMVCDSVSECYVQTERKIDSEKYSDIKEIKTVCNFDSDLSADNITLILNNTEKYKGINDHSYNFEVDFSVGAPQRIYTVPFKIASYCTDGVIFSKQDMQEYSDKYGKDSAVTAGNLKLNENGIIMSDYILEKFGVEPSESLIGSTISLKNNKTGELYVKSLKLEGIIDSKIFFTQANRCSAQIIIPDSKKNKNFNSPVYFYYSQDYSSTYNLFNKLKADNIDCQCSDQIEIYKSIENQQIIVTKVVSVIIAALFTVLFISILTVMYFYYIQQKNYEQMLRAIGMKNMSLFMISLLEMIYNLVISAIIGFAMSLLFINIFNIYCTAYDMYISYTIKYILFLLCLSTFGLMLFSAVIFVFFCFKLYHTSISEFFT